VLLRDLNFSLGNIFQNRLQQAHDFLLAVYRRMVLNEYRTRGGIRLGMVDTPGLGIF
jgi:hypothetical protein